MAGTPQPRALGPDALDVSTDDLAGLLAGNTGRIKTVITDQKVIAGIGNAYSDEILHVAKISPFATAGKLSGAQLTCLHEAMASVLSDAVRRSVGQGAAMLKGEKRSGLRVHARTGLPCQCAVTPCGRCPSRTSLFSTVQRVRPVARRWPTGVCRGCSSSRYAHRSDSPEDPDHRRQFRPGRGMARSFAAQGRDLALCARRTDRLTELKAELSQRYPDIKIAVAELDVNDHERVPKVFAELSDEIGGIDRVIVNAGIGKGARLGSGKLWANKATIETNLVAALVQIETALDMFNQRGSGHLVLISSVLGVKGVPGVKAAYAASKAGVRSLGESLRAEYAQGPIRVTVLEPGYIESEMTAKSASTMLMVDNATGVKALVAAIEREPGRAAVPWWPWAPLVRLMWVLPPRLTRRFA